MTRTLERVTAPATSKIADTLRSLASAVGVAARQLSLVRTVVTVVVITVLVAVALLVRLPSAVELRGWAESLGPWFPLAFLAVHAVVTVVPIPRTAFTLAAGLLFGPVLGVLIAVSASTAQRGDRVAAGARRRVAAQPAEPPPSDRPAGRAPA